jgi:GNAT superfamily N-acetyltransferase
MTGAPARWRVQPFDGKLHDRSAFSCGAPELDRYIRDHASQDTWREVARIFVATEARSSVVVGYYSLSAASFQKASLPEELARRLPHYPVPAVLLGRLAVDERRQGRGLGAYLLMDALDRIEQASRMLAVQALIVDARDDNAAAFYGRYGFRPFLGDGRRLFLPMAVIRRLVGR